MHILVVHTDPHFYRELHGMLPRYGASGAFARSLQAACDQIEAHSPDLIILSADSLAGCDPGSEFLHLLGTSVPKGLIFLTTASAAEIGSGAERARLEAQLDSAAGAPVPLRPRYQQVGMLRIDRALQRAMLDDVWVRLPRTQFGILRYLVDHCGQLVLYRDLMKAEWSLDGENAEARELLKYHLRQIRSRLGPAFLSYLQIVRGEGYVLVNPMEEE
jgi:DNA-binding response OmpR family regulator